VSKLNRRGRHAASGALNKHRVSRLHIRRCEQQGICGKPAGTQCGSLIKIQIRGLGEHVGAGHLCVFGHGSRIPFGQDRASLPRHHTGAIGTNEGIQDHFGTGLKSLSYGNVFFQHASRVRAEDHRRLLVGKPHTLQTPHVMMVHARRVHTNGGPEWFGFRLRHSAHFKHGQRIIIIRSGGIYGFHVRAPLRITAFHDCKHLYCASS
jgi:hypothetical protein